MQIEIEGEGIFEVPDDATPEEIAALTAAPQRSQEAPGKVESGIRGAMQGASFGWGDEIASRVDAVLPRALRNSVSDEAVGEGSTYAERQQNALRYYRDRNAEAEGENPRAYLAGQVAGATAPTLVGAAPLMGARAMGVAATQGAAQGAGYSDATTGRGLASDTLFGTAVGLGGYGAGAVLGKGVAAARRSAANRMGLATAKAGAQAAGEVTEDIASKAGQVGAETQKGSRYIENLMRLEESMTPAQKELFAKLQASGVVPGLQQSVAQGTLEALPGQAATIAAKRAALEAAQGSAEDVAAARAAELLKSSVKPDARSFLKAYAEPAAWAYGANKAAEAMGADEQTRTSAAVVGGIIGGRTRAGKALASRFNRPGNQAALARALEKAAEAGDAPLATVLRRALAAGVPAAAVAHDKE